MHNKRLFLILITALVVALIGSACAPAPAPATTSDSGGDASTADAAADGGLGDSRIAQFGNPVSLDCWDWSSVDEIDILRHFVEPMFEFDRSGTIRGVVAEDWEMVDPTEWIINIRQGMKFHDEQYGEVTAEDVVASLDACFDPEKGAIKKQAGVIADREVEIIDDYTIRVTLPEPGLASLPNYWTWGFISDAEYLAEVGDDFSQNPMGTGPLVFSEWQPNVQIVGERFADYWGEGSEVDRMIWRVIPDDFTRKSEFLTGGIDVLPFMVPDWVPEVEENADTRVESVLSARYIFVGLPVRQEPFNDIRVRQALNYAINRDEIVEQLFAGIGAVPGTGILNPILPEADPDRAGYGYDPELAMQLLDEARADGVEIGPFTFNATNDRYTLDKEMGEAIAGYWTAIGLEVEYVPESRTVLFPRVQALESTNPAMFGFGNTLLVAGQPFSLWLQTREDPRSRGAEYAAAPPEWDAPIGELLALPAGSEESIALARELDEQWTEYAPWVFIINYVDLYGVSNHVDWSPFPNESRIFVDVKAAE